jgi:hypothetical protein
MEPQKEAVMSSELRQVEVGEHVVYVDPDRRRHYALLTAVWGDHTAGDSEMGPWENWPCVNLVYVVDAEDQQDQYGRQIARETSIPHFSASSAPGVCWFFEDQREEANAHMLKAEGGLKS